MHGSSKHEHPAHARRPAFSIRGLIFKLKKQLEDWTFTSENKVNTFTYTAQTALKREES